MFSLSSCTHRKMLEVLCYHVHADALLRSFMTEVPSCPLTVPPSTVNPFRSDSEKCSAQTLRCTQHQGVNIMCCTMCKKNVYIEIYQRFIYID